MSKHCKSVLAVAMLASSSVFALPQFAPGTNTIAFQSFENQYRSTASCSALTAIAATVGTLGELPGAALIKAQYGSSGGCLAAVAAGPGATPPGYQKVDPTIPNNFLAHDVALTLGLKGDIFAGVLFVTHILPQFQPVGEFTGYFAQRVMSIDATVPTNANITLGTVGAADDPFAKLSDGEMFRLYTDASPDFNPAAGISAAASVANATNVAGGVLWASLGLGSEGFAYTLDNLTVSGNDNSFTAKTYYALDLVTTGLSYNLKALNKVNDQSEALVGGTTVGNNVLCSPADLVSASVSCTDFAGDADIKKNTDFGANPWHYLANDPIVLSQIPEPGSMALMGLALVGLGVVRRRFR